ncbi:hypothetical protein [Azoarcus sp. KH32C]|uniref:hypothetical protein n=1 Tax=Azoarcus sp. KH32C TaxID=748247 RepID=UPI0002385F61|nr:hypothetical protein [Azoarcus sp. KH32C]BAL26721.1 hypothetical protein AZKH_4444 [Azoarcus sp. KH32C]
MEAPIVDVVSIVRMGFVLLHLLAMVAAGAGIAFGDYAIFARQRIDTTLLRKAAGAVTAALLVLWVTGLTMIWLDTRFELAALMTKPKLLAKLTVVVLLSLNGLALHRVAFRRLCEPQDDARRAARLPAVLGAISVVTWLHAAFVGLAKPAAALLGYGGFLGLYGVSLTVGVAAALWFVRPRLARRLTLGPSRDDAGRVPQLSWAAEGRKGADLPLMQAQ